MRRSCRGRGRQLARRTWRCMRGSQRSSARRADTPRTDAHPCTAAPHKCILFIMMTLIVLLGSCIHRIVHLVAQLRLIMSTAFSCWAIDGPVLSTYFIFITHGNFPQVYYGIIILNVESLWCIPVCIAIFPTVEVFTLSFFSLSLI